MADHAFSKCECVKMKKMYPDTFLDYGNGHDVFCLNKEERGLEINLNSIAHGQIATCPKCSYKIIGRFTEFKAVKENDLMWEGRLKSTVKMALALMVNKGSYGMTKEGRSKLRDDILKEFKIEA